MDPDIPFVQDVAIITGIFIVVFLLATVVALTLVLAMLTKD